MTGKFDRERRRVAMILVLAVVAISGFLAGTGQITPQGVSLIGLLTVAALNSLGVPMNGRRSSGDDDKPADTAAKKGRSHRPPRSDDSDVETDHNSRQMEAIHGLAPPAGRRYAGVSRIPRPRRDWILYGNRPRWGFSCA